MPGLRSMRVALVRRNGWDVHRGWCGEHYGVTGCGTTPDLYAVVVCFYVLPGCAEQRQLLIVEREL